MLPTEMTPNEVIDALEKLALRHKLDRKSFMYRDYYTYSSSPFERIIYSIKAIIIQKTQRK